MPRQKTSRYEVLRDFRTVGVLLFWAGITASTWCAAQEPTLVVEQLQSARNSLEKRLVSALAVGRLRQQTLKDALPVVTEHDIQIFYEAPKFRVHVIDIAEPGTPLNATSVKAVNSELDEEIEIEPVRAGAADFVQAARKTRLDDSKLVTERLVIFDGNVVYSILSTNGRQRGKIFFDFQQQHVLRSSGYPYVPPLQLWQAGINAQLDPQKIEIQKLNEQGKILEEVNASYTTKYYFFDDFDFDLRRVIFTVPKSQLPFREISLRWGESAGVRYVSRYASRDRSLSDDPTTPPVDVRKIEIEFSQFEANADIADDVFSLTSLNLPKNTPFDDHRANVDGQPKQLSWNGHELVDAPP